MFEFPQPTPLVQLHDVLFEEKGVTVYVKREDLIHPNISGNKWRKLKHNFIEAKKQGFTILLTFGGAYSNHIYATAAAAKEYGFQSIGVIRGEEQDSLNETLAFAQECGMKLHFMNRETYRRKNENDVLEKLQKQFGDAFFIPEGGTNELAVKGVAELVQEIDLEFTHICTACGTGGTLAGLVNGIQGHQIALGFSALKGAFLKEEVQPYVGDKRNWSVQEEYHFGGYAKLKKELVLFMNVFEKKHSITLEPIYTGKMFYGLYDMIRKDKFELGSIIVALHTGGLQGLSGMKEKMLNHLKN